MNSFNCLLHNEPPRNIIFYANCQNVARTARHLRTGDHFEVLVSSRYFSPGQAPCYTVMICYYHPLQALSDCCLYHLSWSVQRVESAMATVTIYGVAMSFPFQDGVHLFLALSS